MDSTAGRLLVASPLLEDPNFARSVVMMIDHDAHGALGVVVDRPTQTAVADMIEPWGALAAPPGVFFLGGPVSPESVVALGRATVVDEPTFRPVVGDVGTIDLNRAPDELGLVIHQIRVFAGYAGWGPGQLDEELAVGGWIVVDAARSDVVDPDPATLWARVLRRQGGELAWLAAFPTDLSAQ